MPSAPPHAALTKPDEITGAAVVPRGQPDRRPMFPDVHNRLCARSKLRLSKTKCDDLTGDDVRPSDWPKQHNDHANQGCSKPGGNRKAPQALIEQKPEPYAISPPRWQVAPTPAHPPEVRSLDADNRLDPGSGGMQGLGPDAR